MGWIKVTLSVLLLFNLTAKSQNCGAERWDIKTLSDKDTIDIDFFKITKSTVQEQQQLIAPHKKTNRLESEKQVYSIDCFVVAYKKELNDKDIHLIIKDINTAETMVVEIPNYACIEIQKTSRAEAFRNLEQWFINNIGRPTTKIKYVKKQILITIIGVGFFDFIHGQTGGARNGREIHPVLSIKKIAHFAF